MKKFSSIIMLALIVFFAALSNVKANEKVKVYIFEAGGCPYCEAEVEYLESLESYDVKFEVIRKELYIDHVNWQPGADYEIGEKTAKLFQSKGFKDASISGTPFVVISNLYASAAYSDDLEGIIDKAYNKGDADVVGCLENGGTDCFPSISDGTEILATVLAILGILGIIAIVIVSRMRSRYDAAYEYDETYKEPKKETEAVFKEVETKTVEVKQVKKVTKKKKR